VESKEMEREEEEIEREEQTAKNIDRF